MYISAETSDAINIYSNVEIDLNFLEMLYDRQLNLNIFNQYGKYIGSFYSANQKNRMRCLIEQVDVYRDLRKRLNYAKKIDMAAIHNLRCNLRYHMKHNPSDALQDAITELSNGICKINRADCIEDILMAEARCRQKYYSCFNKMITNDAFCFTVRSRRPPKDEINAMISFGNVYLYQKIAQIIRRTSLDIRVSFVHSAMQRYENLNLDIADIFKPIIVDRVICMLINKRMVTKEKHFQKEVQGAIFLNREGKEILLQELEHKMNQVMTVNGVRYTYERLIYQEIKNLESSILKKQKYKPFKYRM